MTAFWFFVSQANVRTILNDISRLSLSTKKRQIRGVHINHEHNKKCMHRVIIQIKAFVYTVLMVSTCTYFFLTLTALHTIESADGACKWTQRTENCTKYKRKKEPLSHYYVAWLSLSAAVWYCITALYFSLATLLHPTFTEEFYQMRLENRLEVVLQCLDKWR